jgi:hypothetical protein
MRIPASELTPFLRIQASELLFEVRDQDGVLVITATLHEAQLLCEAAHIEGVATIRGHLKHLRLTVKPRAALARLHRKLAATGRTISEACQTVTKQSVMGRRVLYAHHTRRANTYRPDLRQGCLPVFNTLRRRVT